VRSEPLSPHTAISGRADLRRSLNLFRAFRFEKADPKRFYKLLARDSVAQVLRHQSLEKLLVLDVGGGQGYFTRAFRDVGARCVLVEPDIDEIRRGTNAHALDQRGNDSSKLSAPVSEQSLIAVIGDGCRLPVPDSAVDVCFSSNVLEHIRYPEEFIREMVRVTKPGGLIYLAFTNWLSPWGGHGTAPWHYLGGEWALKRYKRVYGREPINRYGETLFVTHVGPTLRLVRTWPELKVIEAVPRYYPAWCDWVVGVPGLRELATWNLLLIMRRRA
jgi:SAM-dependent methyltransferase